MKKFEKTRRLLQKPEFPQNTTIRILALHGHDDPMGKPTQVQEFMNVLKRPRKGSLLSMKNFFQEVFS